MQPVNAQIRGNEMEIGITVSLFGIALMILAVLLAIRRVAQQLEQMSGTFKDIDKSLSKIVKYLEQIDEKNEG